MVFEIIVEGGVTRLAAVFHAQDPAQIGSVRSARLVDRTLTQMVKGALVYSGTSAHALGLINNDVKEGQVRRALRRSRPGLLPRELPARSVQPLHQRSEPAREPEEARCRDVEGHPEVGVPRVAGPSRHDRGHERRAHRPTEITIPYRADTSAVSYQYDAATKTYARFQNAAGRAVRDVDAVAKQAGGSHGRRDHPHRDLGRARDRRCLRRALQRHAHDRHRPGDRLPRRSAPGRHVVAQGRRLGLPCSRTRPASRYFCRPASRGSTSFRTT